MPKESNAAQQFKKILPIFIVTVSIVFSFVFTILMIPMGLLSADVRVVFTLLLILCMVVASTVAIIFYLFFEKKL